MPIIAHSKPTTGPEEAEAVARVLASGHHARGPENRAFEAELAALVGLRNAHATSSGTTALQLALAGLGVGVGDRVLIPSLTCAAVWNAVRALGAIAVFYDTDYWEAADGWLTPGGGPFAALVMIAPPDRAVSDQDVRRLLARSGAPDSLAGVPIVLDRCQQLAPASQSEPPCSLVACEVYSFYATKCISTGSGGAVASNDQALFGRIVDLNSHDKRDSYEYPRYNFQFDDLRAAVGRVQLRRLPEFVRWRRELADVYGRLLGRTESRSGISFRYLHDCGGAAACDAMERRLATADIEAKRPVFLPLHRYLKRGDTEFPLATQAWQRWLSLPLYPTLQVAQVERVVRDS